MGIGGVGYTGYMSFTPGNGRSGSPAMQQTGALTPYNLRGGPLQVPQSPAQANPVFVNGTNPLALYRSMDGDSVELSRPVRPYALQQPLPAQQAQPAQQPLSPQLMPPQPQQPLSPQLIPPPSQQPLPSQPVPSTGINNEPGKPVIPEMPGSGLLDSLKPEGECQTCANRKYVDGSDDPSVSYQTPTKISSSMSAAAVASHEQEHVRNEKADARRNGREIVSQTVTLQYDCCPECGKSYVSGGTTRTMSVGKKENPISGDNAQGAGNEAAGSKAAGNGEDNS